MIIHKKGSLFDAPKYSVLIHAVNAQGVWASGIAKEFKARFPKSFEEYAEHCIRPTEAVGLGLILPEENDYNVGVLFTSLHYGILKDSKDVILQHTKDALDTFFMGKTAWSRPLHSCKFNSGLFGVPWEETEAILKEILEKKKYTGDWTIWEP
jgi:ADP-ribose 1''-phosphate phosphatase